MSFRIDFFKISRLLLALLLSLGFFSFALATGSADTLTFYAEFTNQSNDVPITGNLDVAVRLYNNANGGSQVWSECWGNVGVSQGRVTLDLGAITSFTEHRHSAPH